MTSLTPNLLVDDMDASLRFYRDALGFEVGMHVPDAPPYGWVQLQHGDVAVMLQTVDSAADDLPELAARGTGGGLTLFVRVDDLDAVHDRVRDAATAGDATIVHDVRETFYGMRELLVEAPEGTLITFAQPVDEGE